MNLGIEEIKNNVKGTFQKYKVKVTVKRTKQTENFICFLGNTDKEHIYVKTMYCRNHQDAQEILDEWNKNGYGVYNYRLIDIQNKIKPHLSVEQVIDDYIKTSGFDFLIQHSEIGVRELIH